ncbi:MAG: hypothetical protein KY464_16590, partial [Gemmatimonadetes bacterium]|nr:hypothetical protein [Gemmatimonadota bacterium]
MQPTRARKLLVPVILLTGSCRAASAPPAAPPQADVPAAQAVAPFPRSTVRLTQPDAARLARAGRDSLNATLAEGLRLEVWAPEGLVFDPVAITLDSLGRAYFTRTERFANSEIDIRRHPDWMIESMTFGDVEDKRRFYQRELAPENSARNIWLPDHNKDGSRDWRDLTAHSEGIYRVEDT